MNEYMHQNLDRHPRNEIWRSETVLVVFTDMWLNNDQVNVNEQNFTGSPTRVNTVPQNNHTFYLKIRFLARIVF